MKLKRFAALLLALLLLTGCAAEAAPETTVSATDAPTESASGYGKNDVTALSDYAVTEADPESDLMRTVVAINADGEACMDNGLLQICYWIEFYNFMSSYGAYASYFGLDYTQPLAQQASLSENRTWEQYFLEAATLHYAQTYALAKAAFASGYELSDEDVEQIADLAKTDGTFAEEYKNAGYESADAYLQANFGNGVCVEDYQEYLRRYYAAADYLADFEEKTADALTDAEIEAYYDENAASYEENRVLKLNNVTVRHILIQPEGEKETESNDWSQEAWDAAKVKADDVYAEWQKDATVENFALLANEYSIDDGSNTTGGIYEDFATDAMVEEFSDWCFDTSRVAGDHGIVKSPFGYHIMYFVGQTETRAWFDTAKQDLVTEKITAEIDAQCSTYTLQFDYAQMRIVDLITAQTADDSAEDTTNSTETPADATESTNADTTEDPTDTTEAPADTTEAPADSTEAPKG